MMKKKFGCILIIAVALILLPVITANAQTFAVGQGAPNLTIKTAFLTKYNLSGGKNRLGSPINAVHRWGNGWIQDFRGGGSNTAIMLADGSVKPNVMWGAIWQRYASLGGAQSFLGYPVSDEITVISSMGTKGVYQEFKGGRLTWHANGGMAGKVFVTYGGILAKYKAIGGPRHALGLPVGDELEAPRSASGTTGRYSQFERGIIVYHKVGSKAGQAYFVMCGIWDEFKKYGLGGSLGYPISDEYVVIGGARSDFEKGYIAWINGLPQIHYNNTENNNGIKTVLVNFSGTTCAIGVKVRSGPGTNYGQVKVIGGNIRLNFDRYSYGTAVSDYWTGQMDERWYCIAGTNGTEWVTSAGINGNAPGSSITKPADWGNSGGGNVDPPASASPYYSGTVINNAIGWANNQLATNRYNWYWVNAYCLKFVDDAYQAAGFNHKRYGWATLAGDALITSTSTNVPRGAAVFYDWYGTLQGVHRNWGHVGISLGNGQFIHAYAGKGVIVSNIVGGVPLKYRGWGWVKP